MMREDNGYKLVLEIEVPAFYVDGDTQKAADEWAHGDLLTIVTEEWMRDDVGLTLVSLPGEKCMNDDFEVHAMNGRIVGARVTCATSDGHQSVAPTDVSARLLSLEEALREAKPQIDGWFDHAGLDPDRDEPPSAGAARIYAAKYIIDAALAASVGDIKQQGQKPETGGEC